jgi:hypothetical protein
MTESLWSPSPGASTFGEIQKGVAGYVLMPTDPEVIDCAGQGIKRAIDRLNTRNWNWALAYEDITFVAGQYDYSLNSSFKAARNFEVWNTSNLSVFRLAFKPWKTFVLEHANVAAQGEPCFYSVLNSNSTGLVTLNAAPSSGWIALYPTGRILFYRRIQYPSATGTSLDVPSEVVAFIQAAAEGYTADRFAVAKSKAAYDRAFEVLRELVKDDNDVQTDWE